MYIRAAYQVCDFLFFFFLCRSTLTLVTITWPRQLWTTPRSLCHPRKRYSCKNPLGRAYPHQRIFLPESLQLYRANLPLALSRDFPHHLPQFSTKPFLLVAPNTPLAGLNFVVSGKDDPLLKYFIFCFTCVNGSQYWESYTKVMKSHQIVLCIC